VNGCLRIPDEFLECVVFVYPSEQSAKDGRETGGSGILVYYPYTYSMGELLRYYVVTNRHVIEKMEKPFLRVNNRDGQFEVIETNRNRWRNHPEGDDLAALPFHEFNPSRHPIPAVHANSAFPRNAISDYDIGIGDAVAMIGRLIGHDGKVKNNPIARFGSIAMLPGDGIENMFGIEQETFLIDSQSIPGFSGSPVFLFLDPTTRSKGGHTGVGPWLLGMDWLHVHNVEYVRDRNGLPIRDGEHVRANTGVAGVIPAWRIMALLQTFDDDEKHRQERLHDA